MLVIKLGWKRLTVTNKAHCSEVQVRSKKFNNSEPQVKLSQNSNLDGLSTNVFNRDDVEMIFWRIQECQNKYFKK